MWSPDRQRIAFSSLRTRDPGVYVTSSKGGGTEERILESFALLHDWSPNGNFIIYGPDDARELWSFPVTGEREPTSYLPRSNFVKTAAQVSPDGRWMAYFSNESGRGDVYLQRFPTASGKWLVSTNGGHSPRWRRDGQELFYVASDQKLMAVSISGNGRHTADFHPDRVVRPQCLWRYRRSGRRRWRWQPSTSKNVSGDGQRFIVGRPVDEAREAPITILTHWTAALKE